MIITKENSDILVYQHGFDTRGIHFLTPTVYNEHYKQYATIVSTPPPIKTPFHINELNPYTVYRLNKTSYNFYINRKSKLIELPRYDYRLDKSVHEFVNDMLDGESITIEEIMEMYAL